MSAEPTGWAAGLLLVIAGLWVLLQTLVAGLPARILSLSGVSASAPITGAGPGAGGSGTPTTPVPAQNPSNPANPPVSDGSGQPPLAGPLGPNGTSPL